MSAMFVESITAPINESTMKSLSNINLENVNNYFEIVDGNKPMHPYIDIDGIMNNINEFEFNHLHDKILDKLISIDNVSIMTSSKFSCMDKKNVVNKLSYRLTFYDEVVDNNKKCKNFIKNVKYPYLKNLLQNVIEINEKKKENCLNVDFSVYRSKGKIRCVNAYKSRNDKSRINKLIKGTIDQTIISANNMNSIDIENYIDIENSIEIESKTEPVLLVKDTIVNEIVETKPVAVTNSKNTILSLEEQIKKLEEQIKLEKEKEKQNNLKKNDENSDTDLLMDNLFEFYSYYFLNDLLNIIKIDKLSHKDWIKIVLSFKKCDGLFDDFVDWNKQYKNFDINGLTSLWNKYEIDEIELTIGTLKHYAKETNPKRYNIWNLIITKTIELCDGCPSETHLAKIYLAMNTDNIVSYNDSFYIFQNNRWYLCNNTNFEVLRYNYRETLYKYFKNIIKSLKQVLKEYDNILTEQPTQELFDKHELFRKHINKLNELQTVTYKTQWINNVIKEVRTTLLNNQTNEDLFDKKHNLFAFANTIFDLNTGDEIPYDKKLYITMNSGNNYTEPTDEQIETIHKLFVSIFPDPEIMKCYLSILRTGLSGHRLEKIVVANGNGRNGKGLLNELFAFLLGNYYYKLPVDVLTKDINMVGANPQLANLNNKRFVVCCEPDDKKSLKMHTAKEITGCDTINARGLYQSNTITNLLLTLVIEANKKPELDGRMDNAILNRLIDVNFVNTFSDNPDLINYIDCFPQNKLYKQYEFQKNHYCAMFKYILLNAPNDLYIPDCVRQRSKEYVVENEDFFGWFEEKYEITNNNDNDILKVKDLFDNYKNSEYYTCLTKKQKRKCNFKSFCDMVKHHIILKNHYRSNRIRKTAAVRLVGIKEKFECDSDSDSDNE